jgi:hypothetical protein
MQQKYKETILDINSLRTLPDSNVYDECIKKVKEEYSSIYRFLSNHTGTIICLLICCAITATIIVTMTSKNTITTPCIGYSEQTLASDVSIECLRWLWTFNKCSQPFSSLTANGWWRRSPQGLIVVRCDSKNTGNECGAGNYQKIVTYIQFCNPLFTG